LIASSTGSTACDEVAEAVSLARMTIVSDVRAEWESAVLMSILPDPLKVACWALRKFANKHGECFPSASTLAATYGVARSTVFRHLKRLDEQGWIEREPGGGAVGLGGRTTLYKLTFPESSRNHSGTTSTSESSRSHGDTAPRPEVVADRAKVVANRTEVVADGAESSRTQSDPRTTRTNNRTNNRTSAPDGARVDVKTIECSYDEKSRRPKDPNVRQEVFDAVKDYGSRDSRAARLFVGARVKDVRIDEIKAAIHQLSIEGAL